MCGIYCLVDQEQVCKLYLAWSDQSLYIEEGGTDES